MKRHLPLNQVLAEFFSAKYKFHANEVPPPCFYQETEFSLYDFQEKHTGSGYQMWDFIILWTFVFRDTEWCWLKWRELTLSKPPYLLWMFMLANLTLFWLLQISLPTITMFLSLPVTLRKCSQLPLLSCITKIPEDQHQDQMHLPVEKGTTSAGQWTRLAPSGILLDPHQKIEDLDWNDGKEINCLVLLKNTTIYSFISKMNLDKAANYWTLASKMSYPPQPTPSNWIAYILWYFQDKSHCKWSKTKSSRLLPLWSYQYYQNNQVS